jgi:hypothetical protein
MIQPAGIVPSNETNAAQNEPFELFSLSHCLKESRFLCKFDDDAEFRRRFNDPGVWYLRFKILVSDAADPSWILAWKKEDQSWRILSLSPVED